MLECTEANRRLIHGNWHMETDNKEKGKKKKDGLLMDCTEESNLECCNVLKLLECSEIWILKNAGMFWNYWNVLKLKITGMFWSYWNVLKLKNAGMFWSYWNVSEIE